MKCARARSHRVGFLRFWSGDLASLYCFDCAHVIHVLEGLRLPSDVDANVSGLKLRCSVSKT